MAKNRSIKVVSQSGYNYKATPTITLKGQWLKELGFDIGDYVSISCENGRLVITPDTERASVSMFDRSLPITSRIARSPTSELITEREISRMVFSFS